MSPMAGGGVRRFMGFTETPRVALIWVEMRTFSNFWQNFPQFFIGFLFAETHGFIGFL